VGSGNVELSLIQQGNLIFSGSIPIGGLRLREHLKDVPMADFADVAEQYISSDMKMLAQGIPEIKAEFLVGAGSLLRWVHQILGHKKSILHKEELKELYQKFKTKSRELISEKYGVPSEYADLIAPSIYIYLELFKLTATDKIHFVDISFTDSLLMQQAGFFKNRYFSKKIWKSSIQLGRKYNFDEKHALQVSKLAGILFDGLQELHQLPIRYRFLLRLAGLWHDIGIFIKNSEHHKHSFYLISSIEMPGLSSKDLHMIATIARYHRNNIPKTYHKEYAVLSRQEKVLVSKLAAILRMADALDRSHRQAIKNLNIRFEGDKLILESEIPEVLWLEKLHFNRKKNLFTRVFGIESEFREVF
jgi:exopolyphosphatase/guanosine-5'-triphosphate,3'-diphosphate pyrophosphatase